MAGETIAFSEVADLVRQTVQPQDAAGMPYIGLEHIEEGTLCLNGYGQAEDVTSTKFRFSQGDILFGKLRPYFRKVIRAPFDGVCSTDIWVVRAKPAFEQGYLYYWMASQDFVDFATQGSEGTKMPRAKWEHVCRYKQTRLPLKEQRAIAHILGTLDDKIELNRKMNETLEAMARAIFKSWFIDFDPVKRNIARKAGQNQPSPRPPLPVGEGRRGEGAKHEGRGSGNYRGGYDFSGLVNTARELRKKQTPAEAILWEMLRNRRFMGLKFRRQHQMGDYVADFYCHEHRLVIELDGSIHALKQKKDHKRDAWMEAQSFTVLRFSNEQVLGNPQSVLEQIATYCAEGEGCVEAFNSSPCGRGWGEGSVEELNSSPCGRGWGEGSVEELDRLFPDSFEDSELGEIPKGWRVGTLSDFCEIVMGQSPPGETYNESGEGLPFYQGIRDFGFRFPNRRVYCNAASRIIQKGDVLLSVRAPVGSLNIAVEDCAIGRGIAALRIKGQHYGFLYWVFA